MTRGIGGSAPVEPEPPKRSKFRVAGMLFRDAMALYERAEGMSSVLAETGRTLCVDVSTSSAIERLSVPGESLRAQIEAEVLKDRVKAHKLVQEALEELSVD